jgi:hypothetical protein
VLEIEIVEQPLTILISISNIVEPVLSISISISITEIDPVEQYVNLVQLWGSMARRSARQLCFKVASLAWPSVLPLHVFWQLEQSVSIASCLLLPVSFKLVVASFMVVLIPVIYAQKNFHEPSTSLQLGHHSRNEVKTLAAVS